MPKLNVPENMLNDFMDRAKRDYAVTAKGTTFDMTYEVGSTYIKMISTNWGSTSVHSFIVNKDTPKFKVGDILKAASWKAPATNFSRGSIFNLDTVPVRWTGI